MKILSVTSLAFPEVRVIRFARFIDHRGFFAEVFRRSDFATHPDLAFLRGADFVQTNESFSLPGTVRGSRRGSREGSGCARAVGRRGGAGGPPGSAASPAVISDRLARR